MLWAFNIQKALDDEGREIPVDISLVCKFKLRVPGPHHQAESQSNGLNMSRQPFPCRSTSRSNEIHQTIDREGRQALETLSIYDEVSERVSHCSERINQKREQCVFVPGKAACIIYHGSTLILMPLSR